jgi:hypothetical protein
MLQRKTIRYTGSALVILMFASMGQVTLA